MFSGIFLFNQSMASLLTKGFDEIFSFPTMNHHSFYGRNFVDAFNGMKVKFDMVQNFYFETP